MTEQELFEEVAQLVGYDPETGSLLWKRREGARKQWNAKHAGKGCGWINGNGYHMLGYTTADGKKHTIKVHRLAWFIVHNALPKHEIDHLNRGRSDNHIGNLRDVPRAVNMRNLKMRRDNTSGVTGVSWFKRLGKWEARARLNSKNIYLGLFDDISEAEAVVKAFRAKHGYTDTHGEAA